MICGVMDTTQMIGSHYLHVYFIKNILLHVHYMYVQVAKYGHLEHAELLMKYGADLHAQNNAGNTPLHVAASHGQVRGREICTYTWLNCCCILACTALIYMS